jgi:HD-GYP domain-containing protein (c-di-GMP phosphodiesterase class II)
VSEQPAGRKRLWPRRVKVLYQLLAVLLVVGVGPLVASSVKLMGINQTTIENGILNSHTQLVSSTAESIGTFLHRVEENLNGMARFQGLQVRLDVNQRQDLLIPFLDSYNYLLGLKIYGAAGQEVTDVSRTGATALWGLIGRSELEQAAASALRGSSYFSTPVAGPTVEASFMLFGVPVRDEVGQVSGSLVALVSLVDLQAMISKIRVGTTGQAFLVDKKGVVIAHRDLALVQRREKLHDLEIVDSYLQTGQTAGSAPFRDRQGREMLGAYDVVPGAGWGVIIEELRDEAYRSLIEMRRQTILYVVLGVTLAVVTGVVFAQRISRPIRIFAEKSLAIARGDFKGTIEIRSLNEIGQLAETFNHMTQQLAKYDRDMRDLFKSTIKSLAASIDAKDPYTRGHSERVAKFSKEIARQLGYDEKALERVEISGLLHDVGKIGIDDAVLRKPSKLTDEEFAIIKKHPIFGASIMSPIKQLQDVLPGMRHHHESLDGKGYPDGLAGGEIPIMARIIAVADTFDAMTSDRLYQKAMEHDFVIKTLVRLSGTRYDPKVVQAFIKAYPRLGLARKAPEAVKTA